MAVGGDAESAEKGRAGNRISTGWPVGEKILDRATAIRTTGQESPDRFDYAAFEGIQMRGDAGDSLFVRVPFVGQSGRGGWQSRANPQQTTVPIGRIDGVGE